jgi:hypothetical protein
MLPLQIVEMDCRPDFMDAAAQIDHARSRSFAQPRQQPRGQGEVAELTEANAHLSGYRVPVAPMMDRDDNFKNSVG